MNGYDNAGLFSGVRANRGLLDSSEQEMLEDEEGSRGRGHAPQVPASRRRRQLGQEGEHRQCEALIDRLGARCGAALLAAACAFAGSAFAGGPLYVVPSGGTLKPAHWDVTARSRSTWTRAPLSWAPAVRSDQNVRVRAATMASVVPVLDEKAGDELVAGTVDQWSRVPTSNFRAAIAGRSPVDITGANVWDYIGKYNGGGIQTIYDADNSVIMEVTGGDGYGVLGIASPEYTSARIRRRSSKAGRSSAARSSTPPAPIRSPAS